MRVQRDGRSVTVTVTADGDDQTVNHAGAALLAETADRLGLTAALSGGLAGLRQRRAGHDPGRVVRDLAVMLADGGDALCDLRTLRDQRALFGRVASDSTAWRVIDDIAEVGLLDAVRAARAAARARVFTLGARPAGPLVIDIDATLITAHSDKDGTGGTYKGGFGFQPLLAYLDCPDGEAGGMPLAGRLRPGNAGSNDARDHIAVLGDALEQLPREVAETETILMRTDSAGLTHELLDFCRDGRIRFSVGFDLTEGVRRERPHPGAQLSFTDHDGHRFQAILTDQPDPDIAALERLHRARARVEDRIRAAKDCGLENLPFRDFDANAVWLELVLAAQDILFYTQTLCLTAELARCEPKRLRYRLLHTAGRLAFHARQAILRLPQTWPWAGELVAAFARLAALPTR